MRVKFLPRIIEDIADIESVEYNFMGYNSSESVTFTQAMLRDLLSRNINSFQMHRKAFAKAVVAFVTINYASGESSVVTFKNVTDLI